MTEPARFPRTRYQGSKRRIAASILRELSDLPFDSVLDAFGGTGAVGYAFKAAGKAVTYNDVLAFNHQIGRALIENDSERLSDSEIEVVAEGAAGPDGGDFIQRTFGGIYFTEEENRWLDAAAAAVSSMPDSHARAMAWFAVFQAAMAKRPYNLFHRANLYMRTAEVSRGFGNKTTWDRSFADHFRAAALEANDAVIDSGGRCRAICCDVLEVDGDFDLVYIDPPYVNAAGVGVDYRGFYHFLEGLVRYDEWPAMIDRASKHLRLTPRPDPWANPAATGEMFRRVFDRFRASHLVVSYRSDGVPSIEDLASWLGGAKRRVRVVDGVRNQYVLSKRRDTREMLLVATDA